MTIKTHPKILDNPYWHDRVANVLATNHAGKYNGVGIRIYSEENAVVIYPLADREFSRVDDYLKLEWFDTHDEGRNFVPCTIETIEAFFQEIANG